VDLGERQDEVSNVRADAEVPDAPGIDDDVQRHPSSPWQKSRGPRCERRRARARSGDAGDAGHRKGAATKPSPGAAATRRAAMIYKTRICTDSYVARR